MLDVSHLLSVLEDIDPISIAEKELHERMLPFIIRRYLPDGSYEDWDASELTILD